MNDAALDILAIETFSWAPHLETCGEICIKAAQAGKGVGFVFIETDNPDDEIPARIRWVGGARRRRVDALKRLIRQQGIVVLDAPRLDGGTRVAVEAFANSNPRSHAELCALAYKSAELGMGAASSLISRFRDSEPDLAAHSERLRRYLRSAAAVFETTQALLRQHRPKSVLLFNGRFACVKPISEAARLMGIPYLFHERGATFERYELFEKQPHDPAFIRERIQSAWEQAGGERERIGADFFLRRRGGDGIGWVAFTGAQRKGSVLPREAKHRLVYYSSSDDEYASVGPFWKKYLFDTQRDAVRFLIDWASNSDDTELIIRVHPNLRAASPRDRLWWNSLGGRNVRVLSADHVTDSYALADSADVVVAYGSTMGIEAAFLGKPSIVLGEAFYRGLGCVYEPESVDALRELLSRDSVPPLPPTNCLPFGHYCLTFGRMHELYTPRNLHQGTFLGEELSVEPRVTRALKASWLGRYARSWVHSMEAGLSKLLGAFTRARKLAHPATGIGRR